MTDERNAGIPTGAARPVSRVRRKLATVLAADVAGYSRLMSQDEETTLRLLKGHRKVFDAMIAEHGGRIANTAGDSVVAVFDSPVEAVRCAVGAQKAMRARNDGIPPGKRVSFRIGINLGDIMLNGRDVLGDGVNIAARIEGIAEPGGISISASVREQIGARLADVPICDRGPQELKNIPHPVRVYDVLPTRTAPPLVSREGLSRRVRTGLAMFAAAVVVMGAMGLGIMAASSFFLMARPSPAKAPGHPAAAAQAQAPAGAPGHEKPQR